MFYKIRLLTNIVKNWHETAYNNLNIFDFGIKSLFNKNLLITTNKKFNGSTIETCVFCSI